MLERRQAGVLIVDVGRPPARIFTSGTSSPAWRDRDATPKQTALAPS